MKRLAPVVVFLLIIGVNASMHAQTPSGAVVGPIYYASLYGVTGDGHTNDYTALNALLTIVDNAGGGTIQLPVTGYMTVIQSHKLVIPGNVNIRGCGMYGHDIDLLTPATPACGLDLQYVTTGMEAKLEFLGPSPQQMNHEGQNLVENLAITDSSTGINEDCSPSVLITRAVVHFQNVSISGSVPSHYGVAACNDGIILGSNVSGCPNMQENDCFAGYGSTFYDISFRYTRLMVQFNTAANGTDWNYIFGDYTNGNGNGTVATGPAILFNPTMAGSASGYPYGNVIRNMQIEQGQSGVAHYTYAIEVLSNAGTNYFYDIVCSDIGGTTQPCVHIAAPMPNTVYPQLVLGCNTAATPLFPGCVLMDGIGSYPDIVADLYNSNPAFYSRNYYGGNLGTAANPFSYLRVSGGIGSPPNMTGVPNIDQFGGIVGFSNTIGTPIDTSTFQLFSDGATMANQFTVFPFETWLGQFTFYTSTNNAAAPIQMQPIYSVGAASQQTIPTVISIPAGTLGGSLVTHAPPFSVSAENQISFQGVHAAPTGATFATVRGFAANIMGRDLTVSGTAPSTVLGTYYNGAVAPSPTIYYTSFSQQAGWMNTTENKAYTVIPFNYTPHGLCVYTSGTQGSGSGGRLVITLRQNGATPTSGPVVTIPATGTAGAWCDNSTYSSYTGSAGDKVDLQLQNYDSATSATIVSMTLGVSTSIPPPGTPTPTGMLVFGLGGRSYLSGISVNNYFAPLGGGNGTTTSANAQVALPRAVTIKNLHCYVTSCPGPSFSNTATITVWQNGAAGSLTTGSISFSCTPGDFPDTTHTMTFLQGDTIELVVNQPVTGTTGFAVSSCTVEHD